MGKLRNQVYIFKIVNLAEEYDAFWSIDKTCHKGCAVVICFKDPLGEFFQERVYDFKKCYADLIEHIKPGTSKEVLKTEEFIKLADKVTAIATNCDVEWSVRYYRIFEASNCPYKKIEEMGILVGWEMFGNVLTYKDKVLRYFEAVVRKREELIGLSDTVKLAGKLTEQLKENRIPIDIKKVRGE